MLIAPSEILTSNGRLRHMVKGDLSAFSEMNADPQVMEFFPRPWSLEESHATFERIEIEFAERGFGIYALQVKEEFAGIVGLSVPTFEAYFTPCVEILWRLLPRFWGRGWKGWWGEEPPYHVPTFVLTHHSRGSVEMKRGNLSIRYRCSPLSAAACERGRERQACGSVVAWPRFNSIFAQG
jgi:hypothetical protein